MYVQECRIINTTWELHVPKTHNNTQDKDWTVELM